MVDDVQVFAFAAITAVSGYLMWRRNMRAANLMEGTATSRVASAAKGYVELAGTARGAGGQPVRDPIESLGCLWYNVVTETRNRWSRNRNWSVERRESSTEPLSLQDDTGSCLIVPGEAKIDEEQDPDVIVKESHDTAAQDLAYRRRSAVCARIPRTPRARARGCASRVAARLEAQPGESARTLRRQPRRSHRCR